MTRVQSYFPDSARRPVSHSKKSSGAVGKLAYVSEFGQFIEDLREAHPEVVEDQHKGWNIYWDKEVELAELEKLRKDNIPVKSYSYE